ncbi:hypothetical protein GCM10010413_57120 [Promicromonospora sukumoe]
MSALTQVDVERAVGSLLGAAVGDALGWPQEVRGGLVGGQKARDRCEPKPEFVAWTRSAGHYSRRYSDRVEAGEYSDDTQLLLAVARSCLVGHDWYEHLVAAELPTWPLYQRGGGGAVLAATNSWADAVPPWTHDSARRAKVADRYAGAGANGVAMRIAPHAIRARADGELFHRVLQDGLTTHGHPRALVGALVYASALRAAFQASGPLSFGELLDAARAGLIPPDAALDAIPPQWLGELAMKQFADTWEQTNQETEELLTIADASIRRGAMSNAEATLESLGCTDPKINGAGTVSAVGALYLASRFAARPMDGLLTAAFLRRGDTDTLASMTGALLGAVHGKDWLGALAPAVQDSDYITAIATALVEYPDRSAGDSPVGDGSEFRRHREQWRQDAPEIRVGSRGVFPDGRRYHATGVDMRTDVDIKRIRLRLEDGQTVLSDIREVRSTPQEPADRDINLVTRFPDTSYQVKDFSPPSGESGVVTALTNSLRETTAFYARLLGREIPIHGNEAVVTEWLHLRQAARELRPGEASSVAVTLHVMTPPSARKDIVVEGYDRETGTMTVRDPDGRSVRIRPGSVVGEQSQSRPTASDRPIATSKESEIPLHIFGDLTDEFYAGVGRAGTLSSMLEDRMRALIQAMEDEPQTSHAGQGASALVTMARKRAPSLGDAWREFDEFATRADSVLRLRNDLVHNLWQPKSGGYFFGHRIDQRTGERRSTTLSIDDVRHEVAELLSLNEEWNHWYMLAGSSQVDAEPPAHK